MIDAYRRLLVVSTLHGLAVAPAWALEYSAGYGATTGYEVNDNINLEPEDEDSISGWSVAIPLSLDIKSKRLEATLSNEFVSSRFDDASYDSDDNYLWGRASYLFKKSNLKGYVANLQESTRTTEFLDTGVVGSNASGVDTVKFGGEAAHSITETGGIVGGFDYSEVEFQSDLYQDYWFNSGYAGWTQRWSERTTLRMQAYGDRYEDEDEGEDEGDAAVAASADSAGVQVGFGYEASNRVDARLLMGWVWTENNYDTTEPDAPEGNSYNALMLTGALDYLGERYRLFANISSMPTPSGDGYLRYTHQIDMGYSFNLTKQASLDTGFVIGRSEAADNRISEKRDFAKAQVGLKYRFAPSWSVATRYEYLFQNQDYNDDRVSGHARSNAVYINLVYDGSAWSP